MKFAVSLLIALIANWLLWSGHFDNAFLLGLGAASCILSVMLAWRMRIVDEEGTPAQLGIIRPFFWYAPWLAKEIVTSNIAVARIILSPVMPLRRNLVRVPTKQKSEIGRVILANSITLTPGTVSVRLEQDEILVHGLSVYGTVEDISGDMGDRICKLERCDLADKPCPDKIPPDQTSPDQPSPSTSSDAGPQS
ncbi:Na+/H+ antiporter subunit E [Neorhodopirellula lusitana]|uniref:Na+/H+ antiporter subunit E n=1 Tax=Neorhodopirellula lusitana TaxID=445327 RepID=UPI0024B72C6A|nr:Na+/H+ antiporter subunit E [Neorhodopirellula lusitana]